MTTEKFSDFPPIPVVSDGDQLVGLDQTASDNSRWLVGDIKTFISDTITLQIAWNNSAVGEINLSPTKGFRVRNQFSQPMLSVTNNIGTLISTNLSLAPGTDFDINSGNIDFNQVITTGAVPPEVRLTIRTSDNLAGGEALTIDTFFDFTLRTVTAADPINIPIVGFASGATPANMNAKVAGMSVFIAIVDSAVNPGDKLRKSASIPGALTLAVPLPTDGFCVALQRANASGDRIFVAERLNPE